MAVQLCVGVVETIDHSVGGSLVELAERCINRDFILVVMERL
ncbi:MAG: hypothetical protein A07HR60_00284 [uncultured archaeon A07HR60]|nr:MAG: hypothetical protein A07HR60_00284 [uncultured archaeon A07HR60]